MSQRANDLADRYERAATGFESALAGLTDDDWLAFVPVEQRTVAALVNHVALAWHAESLSFHDLAHGKPGTGLTLDQLNALNAEHGVEFANADRDESMEKLRDARHSTTAFIRSLSAEELEMRGKHMPDEPERSLAEWIEICLIGHPGEHLPAILEAVNRG